MSKLLIGSIFSFLFAVFPSGKPGIDYEHKRLFRELEKTWDMASPVIEELLVPDSVIRVNHIEGKYFTVTDRENVSKPNYIYIGRVNSCRAGGCSIAPDPAHAAETEYFDYFILFDPAGTVRQVRVFNYQATHGQEVSAKGWLRQFDGYNGTDTLEVGKHVDAISGATISVYGITLDVQMKTALLKQLIVL